MMKYNRCKECGEVTPHRVKLGSYNKLVCNKCDLMNEVTSKRSGLTNILFVVVVILLFLSLIVLEGVKDDFKPLGNDVINIKK